MFWHVHILIIYMYICSNYHIQYVQYLLNRHVNNWISNHLSENFKYNSKLHHFALGHVKKRYGIIDSQLPLLCKISWYLYGNWLEINTSNVCNWFALGKEQESSKLDFKEIIYVFILSYCIVKCEFEIYIELNKYCFMKNFKFNQPTGQTMLQFNFPVTMPRTYMSFWFS